MSALSSQPLVAVTAGEPAGIGPDLCVMLAQRRLPARVVVIADATLLRDRAHALGLSGDIQRYTDAATAGDFSVLHVPLAQPAPAGALNPAKLDT